MTTEKKSSSKIIVTPVGQIIYKPKLVEPDGFSGKYQLTLGWTKEEWKSIASGMWNAACEVGREFFNKPDWTPQTPGYKSPFKDGDVEAQKKDDGEWMCGKVLVDSRSEWPPTVIGPTGEELSPDHVNGIRAGDFVRLSVAVRAYDIPGKAKGVHFALNVVQFARKGDNAGASKAAALKLLAEDALPLADMEMPAPQDQGMGMGMTVPTTVAASPAPMAPPAAPAAPAQQVAPVVAPAMEAPAQQVAPAVAPTVAAPPSSNDIAF